MRWKISFPNYLQDFPLVEVQHLLLEAVVADRLHAHETQDLDQRVLLGDAVLDVRVDLHNGFTTFKFNSAFESLCSCSDSPFGLHRRLYWINNQKKRTRINTICNQWNHEVQIYLIWVGKYSKWNVFFEYVFQHSKQGRGAPSYSSA